MLPHVSEYMCVRMFMCLSVSVLTGLAGGSQTGEM